MPLAAHEAADGVHQRRLARTVGADEPDDLAGSHVQVDVDHDRRGPYVTPRPVTRITASSSAGISPSGDAELRGQVVLADRRARRRCESCAGRGTRTRRRGRCRAPAPDRRGSRAGGSACRRRWSAGRSATLSLKSFGSPTTQKAPRTAPVTDERPPMTTMEMTRSDSAAGKSPGPARVTQPDEQAAGQAGDPAADAERGDLHRGRARCRTTRRPARCRAPRSSIGRGGCVAAARRRGGRRRAR